MKPLIALSLLGLTACGALGANKQQYAGINQVIIETGPGCGVNALEDESRTCDLKMIDGKEKGNVTIKVILADGTTYEYSAGDERAFVGQQARADVDKTVAEKAAGVVSEAIGTVKPDTP